MKSGGTDIVKKEKDSCNSDIHFLDAPSLITLAIAIYIYDMYFLDSSAGNSMGFRVPEKGGVLPARDWLTLSK